MCRCSTLPYLVCHGAKVNIIVSSITHDVEEAVFLSSSVLVVEETPIRSLREIPVPMKYPRTRQDLTRPEIVELREQLVDMLRKQVVV